MSLKGRLKKKARKYVDKAKDYGKKALSISTMGMYGGAKSGGSTSSAGQEYAMKDVARSRAAGSATFNYTDQELRPK